MGSLASIGVYDSLQKKKAVLANFPLLGRLRFMMEAIRPELRQYFWESDKDELKDMMKEVVKAVHKIELMLAER